MIRITTLMDNHALLDTGLEAEHGFSCFIEVNRFRILFDTGKGGAFIRNAKRLGVDLSRLDDLVISHAHYDHGGGVIPLFESYSYDAISMWTGKDFLHKKFADEADGMRYLGPGFDEHVTSTYNIMWHTLCNDTVMIHPGVWLVSGFDRIHPIEQPNPRFILEQDGQKVVDPFCDEICMVIDSPRGLVMIVGCSHPGILNMVDTIRSRFPKPIHMLIGGIHLFDVSSERRDAVIRDLIERSIPRLGASHCTGDEASRMLAANYLGYFSNLAGTVTEIT